MRGGPTLKNVTYDLEVEHDGTNVRGNAMCSGDDEVDREYENTILERLNSSDIWAWFSARVRATYYNTEDGTETVGHSGWLGGNSYKSKLAFVRGGYYKDMKGEAFDDLKANWEEQWHKDHTAVNLDGVRRRR